MKPSCAIRIISHDKIYRDEDDYKYIKLKNSWASLPIIEVYLLKGAWKTNDNGDMFRLFEPNSDSDSDTFAAVDEETNSNCYYIDLTTNITESETADNNDITMADPTSRTPADSNTNTDMTKLAEPIAVPAATPVLSESKVSLSSA